MWTGRLARPSLFFVLAVPVAGDYMGHMSANYGQFCPIAKASEIFATRWTPLIVREVMTGVHSFNDIHRGVPLISRAVLVARLRELEDHGVIERRPRGADVDARRLDLRIILSRSRGELLELQFQLIDEPLAALGART